MALSRATSMNYFKVLAHGEQFDDDAYLGTTALRPDFVWRREDLRRYATDSRHPTAGVEFTLGDGRMVPLPEQQRVAVAYLLSNHEALKYLAARPGVTTFILGLQYHTRLTSGMLGFSLGPSRRLIQHALEVGITPTFYVSFDRPIELADDEAAE
jgi:hypothetical protein